MLHVAPEMGPMSAFADFRQAGISTAMWWPICPWMGEKRLEKPNDSSLWCPWSESSRARTTSPGDANGVISLKEWHGGSMGKPLLISVSIAWLLLAAGNAVAHGGGLDANGCHFKRSTGEYHCHRGGLQAAPSAAQQNNQGVRSPTHLVAPSIDSTCYIGPRGGRYRIVNGRKRYGC